jgi:hypothetical protein
MVFFTLIWPHDAVRPLVWEAGTHAWFWIHAAQAIVFAALAVWAFRGLAEACRNPSKTRMAAV